MHIFLSVPFFRYMECLLPRYAVNCSVATNSLHLFDWMTSGRNGFAQRALCEKVSM